MAHPLDLILVLISVLEVVVPIWIALHFGALSVTALVLLGLLLVVLRYQGFNTHHDHVHTPMFRWKPLASLFEIVLSCRAPITVYYLSHVVIHHKRVVSYSNYKLAEFMGVSGLSTIKGWGQFAITLLVGAFETPVRAIVMTVWSYRIRNKPLEPRPLRDFRADPSKTYGADFGEYCIPTMLAWASKGGNARRAKVVFESLVTIGFNVTLLVISWQFYLFVYTPARFLGSLALGYLEYCSHYGVYSDEFGHDSVSSYGRVYNFFFFNNGLHAEHHLRPKAHWTTLYAVRAEMPPESERKVVSNFFLSPFSDAQPKQSPQSSVI